MKDHFKDEEDYVWIRNQKEYFASAAMTGLLAKGVSSNPEEIAKLSVLYAEALIKELNK